MSGCSQGKCSDSNIPFSFGMFVLAPVLVSTWIVWTRQKKKLDYHRLNLFDRNGGNLLKKKLSKRKKSANAQLKIYTAEEMNRATNNYSDTTVMQRCNPGTFYRGSFSDGPENREVVVMKIPTVEKSRVEQFVDEMIFLSQPHRNLVKIMGCCLETCSPLLIYELHGDGNATVFDCLRDHRSDSLFFCKNLVKAAAGAARGLAYLQSNPRPAIFHGNICSGNILLDADFDAKVFYGVASGLFEGNAVYRDPQFINSGRVDEKSDVYSFGVVLVELLIGGVALASDRWGDDGNLASWFVSLIEENGLSQVVDDEIMLSEEDGRVVRELAAMAARCLSGKTGAKKSVAAAKANSNYQFLKTPKMAEGRDCVTVRVEYLVNQLPSSTPSKPIIDKVDHQLRQVNEKDFEPQIVSVGPIHRGKDHIKSMEQHKVRYLLQLLRRRDRLSIEKFVSELRNLEEKARRCYSASINLDEDEFVEMLLLDGCFVIELIRKYWFEDLRDKNDQIFQFDQTLIRIRHDLMLLENQLPFFVLNHLFNMTKMEDPEDNIYHLLLFFVEDMFPWLDVSKLDSKSDILHNANHLLGLVYQSCFSLSSKYFIENSGGKQSNLLRISSASELKEAGIRLKGITLWDVAFVDGVVKLPPLNISDKTESMFRNLIAYELYFPNDHPKYVTDYAFFMHCLIRSTKDVEILRGRGIISNFLGSDDMICPMFSRLGKNVVISSDFSYTNVFESVNKYNRLQHRRWMGKVKRKYYSSWAVISFIGAAILLLLTFIQTVFCVLSYTK
ncbi:hypothetical protein C2S52_011550 [Perilla frutescens var. hirtella]|nr:hypothetical protein C2S52_011550 [Perilla frutescens var. hirtella]KAH6785802.1 hypothetical protein C2S51_038257 [Perilla frutescens var. frutescens]